MYCKHPEEVCCNMTFYGGKIYCDNQNGFCHLYDEFPPYTNADRIRDMKDNELAKFLMSEWFTKGVCKNCDGEYDRCGDSKFCTKEILKWLKKTAE